MRQNREKQGYLKGDGGWACVDGGGIGREHKGAPCGGGATEVTAHANLTRTASISSKAGLISCCAVHESALPRHKIFGRAEVLN